MKFNIMNEIRIDQSILRSLWFPQWYDHDRPYVENWEVCMRVRVSGLGWAEAQWLRGYITEVLSESVS